MEETNPTVTGNETPETIEEVGTENLTDEQKEEIAADAEPVELAEGETIDSEAPADNSDKADDSTDADVPAEDSNEAETDADSETTPDEQKASPHAG